MWSLLPSQDVSGSSRHSLCSGTCMICKIWRRVDSLLALPFALKILILICLSLLKFIKSRLNQTLLFSRSVLIDWVAVCWAISFVSSNSRSRLFIEKGCQCLAWLLIAFFHFHKDNFLWSFCLLVLANVFSTRVGVTFCLVLCNQVQLHVSSISVVMNHQITPINPHLPWCQRWLAHELGKNCKFDLCISKFPLRSSSTS